MKAKNILAVLLALTLVAAFGLLAQQAPASAAQTPVDEAAAETAVNNLYGVSETGLYIVRFKDPSLASYTGGIAGLAATSPEATGARKLDANSPASRAYLQYLTDNQTQFAAELSQKLDRSVEVAFNYTAVLNAIAVAVSHEEAAQIAAMPGVAAVYGDTLREIATDVGPALIGAPAIWNGNTGYGVATRGEGIVIGVIDSGINSQHPSFAATDGDGYTHTNPYGAGIYTGWCVANPGFCNDKLIGAYNFHPNGGSPEDTDGHGSHTGGTAGGNAHIATFNVGAETYNLPIQGVAPRANIVAYKVCDPSCPGTSSIAAVNSAIANDMVDVLNYSISGSDFPWNDAVDLAFLEASNAGIFVSASAGNQGPGPSTVAKTGPWNASVAASTHNRAIVQTLDVTSQGEPAALQDLYVVPAEGTNIATDINSGIRYDASNNLGCTAFTPGTFTGNLALIQRGGCTFAVKATNAQNAGATGVVLFQSVGGPPITAGGDPAPPMVMMDLESGNALRDHILANPNDTTVRINAATSLVYVDEWEDIVAGFSSRGPSQYEILKPDYIAPGVNILAAVEAGATPAQYGFLQGTSMSSPHGAGAAALMIALQPTWTPAEVRSAMATTAITDLFKEDGATPADPFDIGSGRLDLSLASTTGLVFNETGANYAAANPAIGGDPKTLNQPSVVNYNCTGDCTWTREVKSTLPVSASYTASFSGPAEMTVTVTPNTFTIPAGGTQVITITADVSALTLGEFAFGTITLSTDATWPSTAGFAPQTTVLDESFTGGTFPPADWAVHKLQGDGEATWVRDTDEYNSEPASARRMHGGSADGYQDDWLVTPQLSLNGSLLSYVDRGFFPDPPPPMFYTYLPLIFSGAAAQNNLGWNASLVSQMATATYGYSGVWISTDSCDPADGDFVELLETSDIPADAWRDDPVVIDLSAYDGETACLAFRYGGESAHTWWIDDVVVTSEPVAPLAVSDTNIPVVVVPALATPIITVNADELSATQIPNSQTTQTFAIGNAGGVSLEWEIAEAPVAMRLGLTVDGSPDSAIASSPASFILDDGSGENAIGVGGAQFLWLNRFTPANYNFPITIDTVDVMFGYPGATGGINVGELVDIYLYEDADGNPANGATHVASLTGQAVQAVDGITWSTFPLTSPVTFNGPGDILIAVVNRTAGVTAGTFPAVIDQSSPSQQRSWAGFGAVPGNPPVLPLPTFGIIDSFGAQFAGNWLVRGFGTATFPCENPADVPWLSVDPTNGTTSPSGTSNVTVTFDSTGLTPGDYNAFLCIESNDPNTPLVGLPVMLEVLSQPTIDLGVNEIDATQAVDTVVTYTLPIGNIGVGDLVWDIEEAEFTVAAGPVPAAVRQLPSGSDRANADANAALSGGLVSAQAAPTSILPTGNAVASSWSEGFDDITLLPGLGWAAINNSSPVGIASWFQGNPDAFPAHSGATDSYIGVNFESTAGTGTISNWLLTPEITMNNGDEFTFWTRRTGSAWQDRLQVRLSDNGGSTDVGATATSVGDFTELLLDINPTYAAGGYPAVWTEYTITISGLSGPTNGRLAFRYFVENGGPSGSNSDYIGIDTVSYVSAAPPEPMPLYDNGPWITSFGDGPGGSDVSLLQNSSLGITTLGASVNLAGSGPHFRIADEFVATTPWSIDSIVFYAYQTGSTTTSSFTGVNYRIWDGVPGAPGSNVVYGDTATNRIEDTGWTNVYRFAETALGNTTRPIMYIAGESDAQLPPGTYWLDWQLAGTIASGPWQPPITILGQAATGNALQLTTTGWVNFVDGGSGNPPQGAPFQLWGSSLCDDPSDVSWLSVDPTSGTTAPGDVTDVEVTVDSNGLAIGEYTAFLCVNSNDPDNPVEVVTVNLSVEPAGGFTYVQVAHLSPFAADLMSGTGVTVTLNGAPALTDFFYGDSTAYIALEAGEYDVAVWPTGSATPAMTATVDLMQDTYYTVLATGDGVNHPLALAALVDDLTAPADGNFKLRLGHLAPFAAGNATADIRLKDGTPVITDVNYLDVTGYLELPAGTYDIIITTPGGGTTLIDPEPLTLPAGMIASGFAIGEGVNQDLAVFALPADAAGFFIPDYGPGLPQHFEGYFPPNGWTVVNNGGTCVWRRNNQWSPVRPNYAGGDGFSAAADSDRCGSGSTMNTELWTPLIDLSDPDIGAATIDFIASYRHLGSSSFQVHASGDGGATWDTLLTWTASMSPEGPGTPVSLNLTPYLGSDEIIVSFHYTAPGWDYWAQIDQVEINTVAAGSAFVQVAHLAPFAADLMTGTGVTVTLNGVPALTDFFYGDSTAYIVLDSGEYEVAVWPTGAATPAMTATVNLDPDTYYTVIATGDGVNQALSLVALVDDLSEPAAGNFKLRLGHLAPFASGLATADIRLKDGTPVITDVNYLDVTGYLELPAGTYDLIITTPGGGTTLIDPEPLTLPAGAIASGFATGEGVNQDLAVFALPAGAPGAAIPDYGPGLPQHFEGYFPPNGWTVVNNGGTCVWRRNNQWSPARPNYAGGQGFSAAADSDRCGSGSTMNTELWTPVIDLSDASIISATVDFVASYRHLGSSSFQVHVSGDGGATWDTLLTWTASMSPTGPGTVVSLSLADYVGSSNVIVSFHYTAPGWDYWAQIDQVEINTVITQ